MSRLGGGGVTSKTLNGNSENLSGMWRRRLTCAGLGQDKNQNLGFGGKSGGSGEKGSWVRGFACSSVSEEKGRERERETTRAESESSGLLATTQDMDSANDHGKVDWFLNNHAPSGDEADSHRPPPPYSPSSSFQKSNKFLTLPTILTLGRVAAVPLLIYTFYVDTWLGKTATTSIFIAAAITDWLDGYLARRMRLGTAFGAFLDPVADKLMVAATLLLLCSKPVETSIFSQASSWLIPIPAIAIIGREITMSAVREWAASQNSKLLEAVAVNKLGKWKTATQMTALTVLLATRDSSLAGTGFLVDAGVCLLYVSAWLAVWSLVVYMRKIWKVLLK
ncbi:CDP-alcohol phosphatidyltransferase [Dillenia turbinata]|uniref:CDP-diacylglycerol--glycerol-3-phosphate 1-phosphatidyltransferase n=1 Tax=Dillenia turbinata TaxID=194707 RepID=A0AAN8VGS7_9MAGN